MRIIDDMTKDIYEEFGEELELIGYNLSRLLNVNLSNVINELYRIKKYNPKNKYVIRFKRELRYTIEKYDENKDSHKFLASVTKYLMADKKLRKRLINIYSE